MVTYEQQLDANRAWAFLEGSKYFERQSRVHFALRELAIRLDSLEIEYAVAGTLAFFFHGYRRFTEEIEVVISATDYERFRIELVGNEYLEFKRHLLDATHRVRIRLQIAGTIVGRGNPASIEFPEPSAASVLLDGIRVLNLAAAIEQRLADGIGNQARLGDLAEVQSAIGTLSLDSDLAQRLNPYVREKYLELWQAVRDDPNREP